MKTRLKPKVIVIGAGVSGMVTSLALADQGIEVFLIAKDPLGHIDSVRHSGINAALGQHEDNQSGKLVNLTLTHGEALAQEDLVVDAMARSAEAIGLMERLGVAFDRTPEGHLKPRAALGVEERFLYGSTQALLGRQLATLLADQIRSRQKSGALFLYERWFFLSLIIDDDGVCRGVLAQNQATQEILIFKADAVVLATGGYAKVFGDYSLTSATQDGFAMMRAFEQGATLANAEFVGLYPYAWAGLDFSLEVPDFLLAGAQSDFFIKRGGENFFILKQWYGSDVAHHSPVEMQRLFVELSQHGDFRDNPTEAFLDLTRCEPGALYQSIQRAFIKMADCDIRKKPILIRPGVSQTLGGLVIDVNHQTTIKSVYAIGDVACGYHGAAAVCGNQLLVSFLSGLKLARRLNQIFKQDTGGYLTVAQDVYQNRLHHERLQQVELLEQTGPENIHDLKDELASTLFKAFIKNRRDDELERSLVTVEQLKDRLTRVHLADRGALFNGELIALRLVKTSLALAEVMLVGAQRRSETRGVHVRTDYQARDDGSFAMPTLAMRCGKTSEICFNDSNVVRLNVG